MRKRVSFVTLGARDLPVLRRFYKAWGWPEYPDATDEWAAFDAGGIRLAVFPIEMLRAEAAPGVEAVTVGKWNGITLAMNVARKDLLHATYQAAVDAGALPIAEPQDREWGGRSAYVADPEGNRWEIAWMPEFDDPSLLSA